MTPKQEDALLDYLQEVITPLIEQVLVKKLGQALSFAKEELIQPKREWVGLTYEEMMDAIYVNDTPMERGRRVEAKLKEKNCD
jgi:hypothetical protein